MRLAFLTHEPFFPPSGGGSAEAVYLIEEFVRRGHEIHVFGPALPDAAAIEKRFGIRLHGFRRWEMGRYTTNRNLKYLMYPAALARMVLASDVAGKLDGILAQHTISSVAAVRLRKTLKVPVVLNFLDYLTGFMETWPRWIMPRPVLALLNRYEMSLPRRHDVEGVMTVSTPLAERFIATGFSVDRVLPIQYGFDSKCFPLRSKPLPAAPPVVVMHGSFDRHHLGRIAIEGFSRLARTRPGVTFRLVGRMTPSLESTCEEMRRLVPGIRFELPGFVSYDTIASQLGTASVGVVPYESSPGTHCAFVAKAVEYLACGLPVVSTPLENLQRYFGTESSMRFCGFDGDSLASELDRVLAEPQEAVWAAGVRASEFVRRELDWRVIARRAVDFVEKRVRK